MFVPTSSLMDEIAAVCRQNAVRELLLFGSAVRSDFDPARSDIDLLVEFNPDAAIDWFQFSELQEKFEAVFGRQVHLVSKRGLKPMLRERVLSEASRLYPHAG